MAKRVHQKEKNGKPDLKRLKIGITQEELAAKCGTNKSYISRIEHDASDIKLSTLIKIIRLGLGGE